MVAKLKLEISKEHERRQAEAAGCGINKQRMERLAAIEVCHRPARGLDTCRSHGSHSAAARRPPARASTATDAASRRTAAAPASARPMSAVQTAL